MSKRTGFPTCFHSGSFKLRGPIAILFLQPRPPLTGVSWALRARNPERVSKESPGAFGPGVPEVSETVSKQSPESQDRLFRDSEDCFETVSDTFWSSGPEGPRRLFGDSFGIPGPEGPGDSCKGWAGLQYFSYRAILSAIVSQNDFVLVFLGYRTSIARYVAKWGIALICLCKKRHQAGVSHPVGGLLGWLRKYRAIGGIAAILSQYRAIWGH